MKKAIKHNIIYIEEINTLKLDEFQCLSSIILTKRRIINMSKMAIEVRSSRGSIVNNNAINGIIPQISNYYNLIQIGEYDG